MESNDSPPWDDLRILLALHRHRSFLAVGKALGISTSTAARRIDALEAALGRQLVHRTSGGTEVQADALSLVALAEQIEIGLRTIRRDDGTESEEAFSGTVRLSMGEGAVRPVTQVLCELRRRHPALHLEILSEARLVDLGRREADIAIRSSKSTSRSVVNRAVGHVHFGVYASTSYAERHLRGGRLRTADFARHDFIGFEGALARLPQTAWLVSRGATRFVMRSNADAVVLEATLQGQGIAVISDVVARAMVGLVRLEVDAEPPATPLFLAYHRELRNVPRVRLVLDTLDAALREALR